MILVKGVLEMQKFLRYSQVADYRNYNSLSSLFRKRRLALFHHLLSSLSPPLKILDVGGTETVWHREGFGDREGIEITLLNLKKIPVSYSNLKSVIGDAKNLERFDDNEFDVVFSNSVIEHLYDYESQQKMANEVRRVGKRYFVQTPNLYFPVEPHFLFPFFQFLPLELRIWLIRNFNLGWRKKKTNIDEAISTIQEIRLLTRKELIELFPDGEIYEEKLLGMTKSFVVYGNWD